MTVDFSNLTINQVLWIVIAILGVAAIFVVVRFFFHHILKHLVQGCVVILVVIAILALLRYFGVI